MGRKGKCKGSASNRAKPVNVTVVETILLTLKKYREDPTKQAKLFNQMTKLAYSSDNDCLFGNNAKGDSLEAEASVCILIALKAYSDDKVLRHSACEALCALLRTTCCQHIFQFGGIHAIISIMNMDNSNAEVLGNVLRSLDDLYWNHVEFPTDVGDMDSFLSNPGFIQPVMNAMNAHPDNVDIQQLGFEAIDRVVDLSDGVFKDAIELSDDVFKDLVALIVSVLKRFSNTRICKTSYMHSQVSSQSLYVLSNLLKACPPAISEAEKAGVPELTFFIMENHRDNRGGQIYACRVLEHFIPNDRLCGHCLKAIISTLKNNISEGPYGHPFLQTLMKQKKGALLLFASGNVPFLLQCMEQNPQNAVFQLLGCEIVLHLSRWKETRGAVISTASAYLVGRAMHSLLGKQQMRFVVLKAAESLLVHGDKNAVANSMKKEGGIDALTVKMQHVRKKDRCIKLVCGILHKLASCQYDPVKLEIASKGGIAIILTDMKRRPTLQKVQVAGCKALGMLTTCQHSLILDAIAKADGVNIIFNAIERFPYNRDIFNYGGSAALLAREFEIGRIPLA